MAEFTITILDGDGFPKEIQYDGDTVAVALANIITDYTDAVIKDIVFKNDPVLVTVVD